jgi:HAMP domain-containing protein
LLPAAKNKAEHPATISQAKSEGQPAKVEIQGLSIRTQITLVFVLLVIGALSAVGLVVITKSRSALVTQAERHLRLMAHQKANEYTLVFQRTADEVESVAHFAETAYQHDPISADLGLGDHLLMPWTGNGYGSMELDKFLGAEKLILQQIVRMLVSVVGKNPHVTLGYLGTETNIMAMNDLDAVASIGSLEGYVNTQRPWYIKAKEMGKTIWTAPYVDANTRDLVVTCATPVYKPNGALVGVVGFDVLLTTVQKDILTMDIGYNSYAMLIDSEGKVLVRPGMDRKDTRWDKTYATEDLAHTGNLAFNGIVEGMIRGESGVASYGDSGGIKYIGYSPLPGVGAAMAIVADRREVIKPAVAMQTFILLIWVAGLAVAVVIGIVVGNGITRPINDLTALADSISKGKLDLEILPTQRKDEIGVLTQAFNRLVISLKMALSG